MFKVIVVCVCVSVAQARAIVVQTNSIAEAAPEGLAWGHVHKYKEGSGVAVGGAWLLTAAHVAYGAGIDDLSINGTSYSQQQVVFNDDADLALIRYDKALPGHYSLFTGNLMPEPKLDVLMVGFGNTGNVSSNSWTDSGAAAGVRRWGSQTLSLEGTYRSAPDGVVNVMTTGVYMLFNLGDTVHEAGSGSGDSGGGVFIQEESGNWKLAGLMIGRTDSGSAFTSTFAASIPEYSNWINQTIPEPAAASLLSLSTLSLLVSRSLIRRKKRVRKTIFPIRRRYHCDSYAGAEASESSRKKRSEVYTERWFMEG